MLEVIKTLNEQEIEIEQELGRKDVRANGNESL